MSGLVKAMGSNTAAIHWRQILIIAPGVLLSLLVTGLFFAEWIRIGLIANPEVTKTYYFGSEAMISHGGWRYETANIYAWSAFAEGMFTGALSFLFMFGYIRSSKKLTFIAYLILVSYCAFRVGKYFGLIACNAI